MAHFLIWGAILLLFAAAFAALLWRELRDGGGGRLRGAARRCRPLLGPALLLFAIYLLALSALLRANYNYLDDMQRISVGRPGWGYFGRYVSDASVPFLYGGLYLVDVSPMNQIFAALMMAVAGVTMVRLIAGARGVTVWGALGAVPLGLTPYFLECFSYKFDAIYMAFSVLAAIAPLLLRERRRATYILAAGLGTFLVCTSYQVSLGLFPMLVVLLLLRGWSVGAPARKQGRFLLDSVLGYLLGLIPFRLFVMRAQSMYVSTSLPPLREFLPTVLANYREYFRRLTQDFKPAWLIAAALLALAFLYVAVRDSERAKLPSLIAAMAALALMVLFGFSVYPALQMPLFDPRAMYCVGGWIACLGIVVMTSRRIAPGRLACLGLSWMFIVFALTYGNALHIQKEYEDFRIEAVAQDLSELEACANGSEMTVQVSGTVGHAPVLRRMPQSGQMLNRLVPVSFQGSWIHGLTRFFRYYGLDNLLEGDLVVADEAHDMPVLKDTAYHTIRGAGDAILVELKE